MGGDYLWSQIELLPDGYREDLLQEPRTHERERKILFIDDEALFWQSPRESRTAGGEGPSPGGQCELRSRGSPVAPGPVPATRAPRART